MYLLIAEIHLVVREPVTASAGWALYQAAVLLDQWAYRPELHLVHGHVAQLTPEQQRAFDRQLEEYMIVRRRFINAGRTEFGRAPFPEDGAEG